jgi:hypothetical protein
MKVKVNTIWKGQVAVRNKFVDFAIKNKECLCIEHDGVRMFIPPEEIESRIRGRRANVPDKFSNEKHTLYYFVWSVGVKPDQLVKKQIEVKQQPLL